MSNSTLACVSCLTMRASIANFLPCFMTSINRWAFPPLYPITLNVSYSVCIHSQLVVLFHNINRWTFCPSLPYHIYRVLFCVHPWPVCCHYSWPQSTGGCFVPLYPVILIVFYFVCVHSQHVALSHDLNQQVDVLPTLPCHTYRVCFFFVCFHSQHVALSHDITQQVDISGCGQRSCVCWFLLRSQVGLYICTSPPPIPTNKWTLIHWRAYRTHPYVIDQ